MTYLIYNQYITQVQFISRAHPGSPGVDTSAQQQEDFRAYS